MILFQYTTRTSEETMQAGHALAGKVFGGDIITLQGDLGAGKTTFAKGFGAALGIAHDITSPTFTLMNLYASGSVTLCHIDTYRIRSGQELVALGMFDYAGKPGVITLIEWPEKIDDLLEGMPLVRVEFAHAGEGVRNITARRT